MTDPRRVFAGTYAPALLGAAVSVLFARFFTVVPLFLIPVGIVALTTRPVVTIYTVVFTLLMNVVIAVMTAPSAFPATSVGFWADFAYFALLTATFAWAIYGADGIRPRRGLRTVYRIGVASIVSSLGLIPLFFMAERDQGLVSIVRDQAAALMDAYKAGAGADVVQQSLIENGMSVDSVTKMLKIVVSRGALFSHVLFFGLSWRFAHSLVCIRYPVLRFRFPFVRFRNDFFLTWVLIASLLVVLLSMIVPSAPLEIVGWNVLFFCVLLFGVQGIAIIAYNLSRPGIPRLMRPIAVFFGVFALLRPGINAYVVVLFTAIGVAENWLPLRATKTTEPPPTPGA